MDIESETICKFENFEIKKQINNEYGNGYELYFNGKFIGAWDTLESLFGLND